MSLTMSEDAKNELLDEILNDNERYISKIWATIKLCTPLIMKYSTLAKPKTIEFLNVYAYFGITKNHLNIVTLSSLNVTASSGSFSIPRSEITDITIKKKGLSYSVVFYLGKEKIFVSFPLTAIGTNIKNQHHNTDCFIQEIS